MLKYSANGVSIRGDAVAGSGFSCSICAAESAVIGLAGSVVSVLS